MNTIEDIRDFMQRCVGFDNQGGWMSLEPVSAQDGMGFTYIIHDTEKDMFYGGCKLFWFKRLKLRSGKKKRVTTESDWKTYYGSSKHLTAEIEARGEDSFDRYIVDTWKTKRSIANSEADMLHNLRVLTSQKPDGSYWFYNQSIGKAFRNDKHTEEVREKISQTLTGRTLSKETREKMSNAHKGKKFSQEHKAKMSEAQSGEKHHGYGKPLSQKHREKISEALVGEKHPRARLANIYCHETDKVIAERVALRSWCRETGYTQGLLSKTARSDRSLPSTDSNPHQHKGIYARYLDDDE